MNFFSIRDLKTSKIIWDNLSTDGEVVITKNGKPAAILIDISNGNFEETLKAIHQAKAMIALNTMRSKAAAKGFMSDEEIEKEIITVRRKES